MAWDAAVLTLQQLDLLSYVVNSLKNQVLNCLHETLLLWH